MSLNIYFLRSGECCEDDPGRKALLTGKGIEQASKAGMTLRDIAFKVILSSPMPCAMKTAELVKTLNTNTPVLAVKIESRHDLVRHNCGESDSIRIAQKMLDEIRKKYSSGNILVVTHRKVIGAILAGHIGVEIKQVFEHTEVEHGEHIICQVQKGLVMA